MKRKYFDCSINVISNNNHIITNYGPLENDIMYDLGLNAHRYGFERIYDYQKADVIVTNTIYPDEILEWSEKHSISKIKRNDGIYWQNDLKQKNEILNIAAKQSDHVIFISDFSKRSLETLYGFLPNKFNIILNNANDEFYINRIKRKNDNNNLVMISSATNWDRECKRFKYLIEFSKYLKEGDSIKLLGKCTHKLPKNVHSLGYIDSHNTMSMVIGCCDIFLSLFFRDAGSKVTYQGLQSHLPVLYVSSGGLPEIVEKNGICINDYNEIDFMDKSPRLNLEEVISKYLEIRERYHYMINHFEKILPYQKTMEEYFKVFKKYC
jgi:glycosyltransferase involved in cell wall biosynthesis